MSYQIEKRIIEPMKVAFCRDEATSDEIARKMPEIFQRVVAHAARVGAEPDGPAFARYFGMEEPFTYCAGFRVETAGPDGEGVEFGELPGGEVLTTVHMGPYDQLKNAYQALMAYVNDNGLTPADSMWELYWTDPQSTPNPAEWKTEVFIPLA